MKRIGSRRSLAATLILLPLFFLLGGRVAQATIFVRSAQMEALTSAADFVGLVKVKSLFSRWRDNRIETVVQAEVEQSLKGSPAKEVTLTEPGGKVGDVAMRVIGLPPFTVGQRSVLFLKSEGGIRHLLDLGRGRVDVLHDTAGHETVLWKSSAESPYQEVPLDHALTQVRQWVRAGR